MSELSEVVQEINEVLVCDFFERYKDEYIELCQIVDFDIAMRACGIMIRDIVCGYIKGNLTYAELQSYIYSVFTIVGGLHDTYKDYDADTPNEYQERLHGVAETLNQLYTNL